MQISTNPSGWAYIILIIFPLITLVSTASIGTKFIPRKRIVGGTDAKWMYQRHMAYLELFTAKGRFYPCSGTVIGRRWVLTTAHCIQATSKFQASKLMKSKIYIGSKTAYPQFSMRPYTIKTVHIHKKWKPGTSDFRNDIALLMLRELIDEKHYYPTKIGNAPPPKTVVTAVGYGALNENGQLPSKLMQANLLSQSFRTCTAREEPSVRKFLSSHLQVCATSIGFPEKATTDTCYGDSGGPLFIRRNEQILQYAITSFASSTCAEVGGTPWYVRVSFYKKNLQKIMWKSDDEHFRKHEIKRDDVKPNESHGQNRFLN